MPKKSKVSVPHARPISKPPSAPDDTNKTYICFRCGASFKVQRKNFSVSHSPLYIKNGGYLPVCCKCVDEIFEHYLSVLGDERLAMRRVCMKFDIYWSEDVFSKVCRSNTTNSRFRSYLSQINLFRFVDKTYDDTLDEESNPYAAAYISGSVSGEGDCGQDDSDVSIDEVTPEMISFWGSGFDDDYYRYVQSRYNRWTKDLPDKLPVSTEALYKQICMTEATISRDTVAGRDTDKSKATLINLLGALNEKPIQKMQEEQDLSFDEMPFGVGIRMCENTRPIPKPDPELEDVDNVVRYVSIWFLGHLCKMLGIKNTYCKLYDDEMSKLRVERDIPEDEDDEGAFNDIFGNDLINEDETFEDRVLPEENAEDSGDTT